MLEVEVKARLADVRGFEEMLIEKGAEFVGEEVQEDIYLQHPCRDFAETDEALRLRLCARGAELTYKGKRVRDMRTKTREEVSVGVEAKAALELLQKLGFREVARIRKRRRSYRLGSYRVELDEVEGLGCFVEVEAAPGTAGEELVEFVRTELGIEESLLETRSYLELYLEGLGCRS
ncbi:MAG: class IV adenylate cyclase [Euryarchaeota archaeon]|nr:class IV adenylate cyclase [Euryarchaeota archaeon]